MQRSNFKPKCSFNDCVFLKLELDSKMKLKTKLYVCNISHDFSWPLYLGVNSYKRYCKLGSWQLGNPFKEKTKSNKTYKCRCVHSCVCVYECMNEYVCRCGEYQLKSEDSFFFFLDTKENVFVHDNITSESLFIFWIINFVSDYKIHVLKAIS